MQDIERLGGLGRIRSGSSRIVEFIQFFTGRLRHSFWALPLVGCVIGVALAVLAKWLDGPEGVLIGMALPSFTHIEPENARTLLGAIAGAAATMLSLTYTLTLVVFTLAAGALAPRLLESFSDNRSNQIAIAVLGGTFLYALVSLYLLSADLQPRFAALVGITLAMLSVGNLVYFVHDVAQRVLVDNEIARATERLKAAIMLDFCEDEPKEEARPASSTPPVEIVAKRSGYVQTISKSILAARAAESDAFIELEISPGDFIAEGCPIARLYGGEAKDWSDAFDKALIVGPSRTSDHDVLFCVHLLVEIALRALSPGVNDSFTAVRCIDQLSAALAKASRLHPRPRIRRDEDGEPRLAAPVSTFEDLLSAAFDPIRQDAKGNDLAEAALHRAYQRLRTIAPSRHQPLIEERAGEIPEAA